MSCEEVIPSPCTFPCMVTMRCEIFMGGEESPAPFWCAHVPAVLDHTELYLLENCYAAVSLRLTQTLAV